MGSHLEELSVFIRELRGSLAPSRVSMSGFQRLQKLEFPLEIAICNMTTATAYGAATPNTLLVVEDVPTNRHQELDDDTPFISDLVPASIS
jgi:hypothetical protein